MRFRGVGRHAGLIVVSLGKRPLLRLVGGTNGGFRSLGDLSLEKSTDFHNIYIYISICV